MNSSVVVEILTHPLVLYTGLGCLAAQGIFHVLFAFVLPKGPWTDTPSFTAHQLVNLPIMMYVSYMGFAVWFFEDDEESSKFQDMESRIFEISEGGRDIGRVIVGILLYWDMPVGFCTPQLLDTIMTVHHVAMIFVSGVAIGLFSSSSSSSSSSGGGHPIGSYYGPFFFGVIELSTCFLLVVDLFHPKHKYWFEYLQAKKGPIGDIMRGINEVCRVVFALTFLILRAVYFPYVMFSTCLWDFWAAAQYPDEEQRHGATVWSLYATFFLALLFSILQMYWGTLVGKGILKAVGVISDEKEKGAGGADAKKKE